MISLKLGLLLCLLALSVFFLVYAWRSFPRSAARPSAAFVGIGAITNFFDALGIGSFATTTSLFKLGRKVADELIPGTLNAGHTLPTVAQALIYITIVKVDPTTLALMIAASVLGAWSGAGVVSHWPRRQIQIGMGFCLLGAATLMLMSLLGITQTGGEALGLSGTRLGVGLVGNYVLGALMTLGIGLYGPCLILISLLGMAPNTAYPIMMGSCAFLMPVASLRFIDRARYHPEASLGLTLGGVPAVLVAAYVVGSLSLNVVKWLVVVVVVYTATMMLRSAQLERKAS